MASGKITKNITSHPYQLIVDWSSTSTISTNSSKVTAHISLYCPYALYIGTRDNTIVINGITYSFSSPAINTDNGGTFTLGTITSNAISHNADGSKSIDITCNFSLKATLVNTYYGTVTASDTVALDNIPRAATILTAPDWNDETASITITYTNPAGNAVDSLQACISSDGSTIEVPYRAINKTGTSYTFTFTQAEINALLDATTNSNSRTFKVFVTTVIGGVTYYSSLTKTFSIIDNTPTLNPEVYVEDELTGYYDLDLIIKGVTCVSYRVGAEAKKRAKIVNRTISVGGKYIGSANDYGSIEYVDGKTFTFTCTDSRGNTATATKTFTYFAPYVYPSVKQEAKIAIVGESEANIALKISGNFYNGEFIPDYFNSITVRYRYKEQNGSYGSWNTISATKSGNKYEANTTITGLDYSKAYVIQSVVFDAIAERYTEEYPIKLSPIFDWSNKDFSFNVPVSIEGDTINDFVINSGFEAMGTGGIWKWVKWKSGKAECWGSRNYGNMDISTAWGSWYESNQSFKQDFPTGLFRYTPDYVNIHILQSSGTAFVEQGYNNDVSKYDTGSFCLCRPTALTLSQVYLGFYAIGKWK